MAEQIFPEPTVGPIIYNDKEEILLIRSPKWGEMWHIPGGHIELGETSQEALIREIMEETGLEIDKIEFIGWQDAVYPKFFHKKRHFIFIDFCAHLAGGEITKSDEMEEYIWIAPKDAIEKLKIDPYTLKTIGFYLDHIEKSSTDIKEMENNYKRALADYHNLMKQTAKEKYEFSRYANEAILHKFIPVYDNLKMSILHSPKKEGDAWHEGVKHVIKQFKGILDESGVEEIKTTGEKFDHNTMEAISNEDTDDKKKDGFVAKEIKAGYILNGKVIIPARVTVYQLRIKN